MDTEPRRPRDMTPDELDRLPLLGTADWTLTPPTEALRPDDLAAYVSKDGHRYKLERGNNCWYRARIL